MYTLTHAYKARRQPIDNGKLKGYKAAQKQRVANKHTYIDRVATNAQRQSGRSKAAKATRWWAKENESGRKSTNEKDVGRRIGSNKALAANSMQKVFDFFRLAVR